ncbi:MAG: hypothetical protein ACO2ZM_09895 [Francisellaceae bacterium]
MTQSASSAATAVIGGAGGGMLAGMESGVLSDAATQGINIAMGNQKGFNWKETLVSAGMGAAGNAVGNSSFGQAMMGDSAGTLTRFSSKVVMGETEAYASTALRSAMEDDTVHFNWEDVGKDSFGNALGNAAGSEMVSGLQEHDMIDTLSPAARAGAVGWMNDEVGSWFSRSATTNIQASRQDGSNLQSRQKLSQMADEMFGQSIDDALNGKIYQSDAERESNIDRMVNKYVNMDDLFNKAMDPSSYKDHMADIMNQANESVGIDKLVSDALNPESYAAHADTPDLDDIIDTKTKRAFVENGANGRRYRDMETGRYTQSPFKSGRSSGINIGETKVGGTLWSKDFYDINIPFLDKGQLSLKSSASFEHEGSEFSAKLESKNSVEYVYAQGKVSGWAGDASYKLKTYAKADASISAARDNDGSSYDAKVGAGLYLAAADVNYKTPELNFKLFTVKFNADVEANIGIGYTLGYGQQSYKSRSGFGNYTEFGRTMGIGLDKKISYELHSTELGRRVGHEAMNLMSHYGELRQNMYENGIYVFN